MSDKLKRPILSAITVCLLAPNATHSQQLGALFLPQDEQLIEDLGVVGTTSTPNLWGLRRMIFPGSDTIYYVIDQRAAFTVRISDAIAAVGRNDSDISIHSSFPGPEFVHMSFSDQIADVMYSVFEEQRLFSQLSEFFEAGGFANGRGLVEYQEYHIPVDSCPGLSSRMADLRTSLQEAVATIGNPPETRTMIIDGASYDLHVRLGGGLRGRFGVGANDEAIFGVVRSLVQSVRECQMQTAVQPVVRTREF